MLDFTFGYVAGPGDTFSIFAPNEDSMVVSLIQLLNSSPEAQVSKKTPLRYVPPGTHPAFVEFAKGKTSMSLVHLLTFVLDIKNPGLFLKKLFLMRLVPLVPSKEKKEFIQFLVSSAKEASKYYSLLLSTRVDLVTFLSWIYEEGNPSTASLSCSASMQPQEQDEQTIFAPSKKIPIEELIDCLSPISGRQYSLVSYDRHQKKATIVFNDEDRGHCTNWLSSLSDTGIPIPLLHKSATTFCPPKNPTTNIIMIAHGTGIAPFHSFLQSLQDEMHTRTIWLIYGCRNSRHFLLKESIDKFLRSGVLSKLSVAYSRSEMEDEISDCDIDNDLVNGHDKGQKDAQYRHEDFQNCHMKGDPRFNETSCNDPSFKRDQNQPRYVQDIVWRERKEIYSLMSSEDPHPQALMYICGDESKMIPELLSTMARSMEAKSPPGCSGEGLVKQWISSGKILREIWA